MTGAESGSKNIIGSQRNDSGSGSAVGELLEVVRELTTAVDRQAQSIDSMCQAIAELTDTNAALLDSVAADDGDGHPLDVVVMD